MMSRRQVGGYQSEQGAPVIIRLSNNDIPEEQTGKKIVQHLFQKTPLKNLFHQGSVAPRVKSRSVSRLPYHVYSEFEVTHPRARQDLWVKDVTRVLKELSLSLWISPDDSVFGVSYPAIHRDIWLTDFSFGSFLHPDAFLCYYCSDTAYAKICFQYDCSQCFLYLQTPYSPVLRLELKLNRDVKQEILVEMSESTVNIYMFLLLAPRLSKAENLSLGRKTVTPKVEDVDGEKYEFSFSRVKEFEGCSADIIGGSNCLRLQIPLSGQCYEVLQGLQGIGYRMYFTSVNTKRTDPMKDKLCELSNFCGLSNYGVIWALKTVLSRGLYVTETLYKNLRPFVQTVKEFNLENSAELEKVLYRIADMLEMAVLLDVRKAVEYFKENGPTNTEIVVPRTRKLRRLVLTPTKQLVLPPQLTFENRILRGYNEDYCLRVSFRDDNMQKLSGVRPTDTDFFNAVVKKPLKLGIREGERHYEFLACSNSQLKDHGVWFYAEDPDGNTASSIRESMGDLSGINCVASYVARMGQCFSTTEDSISVPVDGKSVKVDEDDITQSDHKTGEVYTFSDGTGRISYSLADKVSEATGRGKVHSMYQIRYGGCKGTVSLDPELEGDALLIRKSMNKFHSDHQRLEIAKVSQPCPLFLNHSAIMLLNDLGVPTSVFLKLQGNMLNDLVDMLLVDTKAAQMLSRQTSLPIKFMDIVNCGISLTREPLFRQMLHAVLAYRFRDIQNKARISLPDSHARNMLGAMDETGTLKYGQVFVQYTNSLKGGSNSKTVLTGDVLVTKFPALHQGDIRRFVAVDITELHHMVDCIVFPSQGPRPHPNEMAGSDLDGDEYFVTWLPEFLEHFPKHNETPMAFPPPEKQRVYREVNKDDIIEFVKEYMRNDRLGLISNAHKAHADEKSIYAPVCQRLAEKHSKAVDFAKTGFCPELENEEKVRAYPEFMGKQGLNCVRTSRKALGQLYRVCRHVTNLIPGTQVEKLDDMTQDKTSNSLSEIGRCFEDQISCSIIYTSYKSAIREMMNRYGIESEAELFSGCIRRLHLRLTQRGDMFETITIIKRQMQELLKGFRRKFFQEFGGEERCDLSKPPERMLAKAAAWYYLSRNDQSEPARSFPWVVSDILCKCYSEKVWEILPTPMQEITQQVHEVYRHKSELCVDKLQENQVVLQHLNSNPWLIPILYVILTWVRIEEITVELRDRLLTVPLQFIEFAIQRTYIRQQETSVNVKSLSQALKRLEKSSDKKLFADGSRGETPGHVLMSFFQYFGSQADFNANAAGSSVLQRNLQRSAHKAYFTVAITGNLRKLLDRSLTGQPERANIVIGTTVWKQISGNCSSIEKACMAVFEGSLTSVTLRSRKSGKYPEGLLSAEGNGSAVSKLEELLSEIRNRSLDHLSRAKDFEQFFRTVLDNIGT